MKPLLLIHAATLYKVALFYLYLDDYFLDNLMYIELNFDFAFLFWVRTVVL